jgi:hypothetical protein
VGSTICVRCGADLIPHSYCDVCHGVLCFTCSSCYLNTDERIHVYCRNIDDPKLDEKQKLMYESIMNKLHVNNHYYMQNQLNDSMKDNSISLLITYWDNIFKSIKLVNRYWSELFKVGIDDFAKASHKI